MASLCYCDHLLPILARLPWTKRITILTRESGTGIEAVLRARRVMQKFGSCCSSVRWQHRGIKRAQKPTGNVGQTPGLAYWFADHDENLWSLWCLQSLLGTAERKKSCHACYSVTPSEESRATLDWDVLFLQPRAPLLGLPSEGSSSKGAYRTLPLHLFAWTVQMGSRRSPGHCCTHLPTIIKKLSFESSVKV